MNRQLRHFLVKEIVKFLNEHTGIQEYEDACSFNVFINIILKDTNCIVETLIPALVYIKRIINRPCKIGDIYRSHSNDMIKVLSCQRKLFVVSLVIAFKYICEECRYMNYQFIELIETNIEEFNLYEMVLLHLLEHRLEIGPHEYLEMKKTIGLFT
ncbi:MAG TPA: hypothetical protein VIY08_00675 [Candidatus Nitrosocosmicus sp.]